MDDLIKSLRFVPVHKKDYEVQVSMPVLGTQVINKLENIAYTTTVERPFVIRGTVGETWAIDLKTLQKNYEFIDGRALNLDNLVDGIRHGNVGWLHLRTRRVDKVLNFATLLPTSLVKDYPIETSWGDTLMANATGIYHGDGDFAVCSSIEGRPNLEDVWVVNGCVFANTYEVDIIPEVQ